MYKKVRGHLLAVVAMAGMAIFLGGTANAAQVTEENLPQLLEKIFRERPDIIMDVLRNDGEAILDIAQQGSNLRRKRNLESQWREDMKSSKSVRLEGRPSLGSPRAKVRIVAFSDFTCHYCRQASVTVDALLKQYGKDVSLVFKALPKDDKGPGAMAAAYFVAAGQQNEEKAWKLYKALFNDNGQLQVLGEEYLKKVAAEVGLDVKRLSRDARSKKVSDILEEDRQDSEKVEVEGTPSFLVNNLVVRGAVPLDLFKSAVDMAMKERK